MKWILYRWIMRLAHKHDWHYAPPLYPEGDTMLWCRWCGFRQVIRKGTPSISTHCPQQAAAVGSPSAAQSPQEKKP